MKRLLPLLLIAMLLAACGATTEETPTEPAPRAGPYALGHLEVSGFVEHELRCSGCGEAPPATFEYANRYHYVPVRGGWRKCGEWR